MDSTEATRPEVRNQHPERQRQPPIRHGLDEFADTVTEDVHHAAYNVSQIMNQSYAGSLKQVIMLRSVRLQQTQNLTRSCKMKHGNRLSYPVVINQ